MNDRTPSMNTSRTSITCRLGRPRGVTALAVVAALLAGLAGGPAAAKEAAWADDEENPHVWRPQTTSVAVFKNGLGFFLREGDVRLRDGWCAAGQAPPAAFGTLAVYSLDESETVDLVGSGPGEVVEFDGVDSPNDTKTKLARLKAVENLRVELVYAYKGNDRTAAGKAVDIGPEYVVLEDGAHTFAVPIAPIKRMALLELPLRVHVSADNRKTPTEAKLGMAYLRKGITWIPEYTLKVIDENAAELTLRGTLVNEAEDLIHCDVNFVVGVPHFLHTDYLAPIAVGQIIRTIGAAVAPRQVMTQIMNRAAIATHQGRLPGEGPAVVERTIDDAGRDVGGILNLPQMGGAATTDYTVYTKKDLTVRRGEKAIVTLFKKRITYSHIYQWNPPGEIQHFFVLHNDTDTAWTTSPCLAVDGKQPLTEDLLKYTAKGGTGELPVTTAVNVSSSQSEAEIERKLKAHSPSHNVYLDLVTLEGTLIVQNFEERTVDVRIRTAVEGKPVSASDGGKTWTNPKKLILRERDGTVTWTIRLEPGQTHTLTYRYERYVRSN